jgi:hypothetical protein
VSRKVVLIQPQFLDCKTTGGKVSGPNGIAPTIPTQYVSTSSLVNPEKTVLGRGPVISLADKINTRRFVSRPSADGKVP